MSEAKTSESTVATTFDGFDLDPNLLRGIYGYGYEAPSQVQQKGIPAMLEGLEDPKGPRDTIAQAQSGTGKTATFSIAVLQGIAIRAKRDQNRNVEVLILSSTRELVKQIGGVVRSLGDYMAGVDTMIATGGVAVRANQAELDKKPKIVVGTPGRVLDLIQRKSLRLGGLKTLVLDEADEMLSMGFRDQLHSIMKDLPNEVQVCLFSATLPDDCKEIANRFMRSPQQILVKRDELTLEGIKQYFVDVDQDTNKFPTLSDIYSCLTVSQAIIFCGSQRRVECLTKQMEDDDHSVSYMHAGLTQQERDQVMRQFASGSTRVLITTDLLARGIDGRHVSLVINYDMPRDPATYLHRIGRSGRFGRKGVSINFLTYRDRRNHHDLQRYYSTQIDPLPATLEDLMS